MSQVHVKTFQCLACREYINVSARECRFCGVGIDYNAALADAEVQEKVAQAVNHARMARVLAWSMLVFWSNAVLFYFIGQDTGFYIFIPVMFLLTIVSGVFGWWPRFGKLQSTDPDYGKARQAMKTTVAIAALLFIIPGIVILIVWSRL